MKSIRAGHASVRQSQPGETGQFSAEDTEEEIGEGGASPVSASSEL